MSIDAHLEVQVGTGRVAGRADERDRFAAVHLLADDHEPRRSVAVARRDPVAMIDVDIISVAGGA